LEQVITVEPLSKRSFLVFEKMLAARRLPQILQDSLTDGIDGMCLMTKEGSLLSSAFAPQASVDETALAAISSSIWGNYSESKR
jgi:hypothetical protein